MLDNATGDRILMRQFFECFCEKGFGILLMMFALPSALPVPAPGYSIPFGIILALLAGQLILG
ncbi:MAG: exopolysaccharide biosynthesis protein, partial [Opitutae bacterium]|nr:exopolysaccharide biosynthesis protein [Opitutae bacterium]